MSDKHEQGTKGIGTGNKEQTSEPQLAHSEGKRATRNDDGCGAKEVPRETWSL